MNDFATDNTTQDEAAKPPISDARQAANTANAQRSTGPKSVEGKRRSSLNATRSRLHGQIECLPHEDLVVYQKLLDEIIAEYEPAGPTEKFYSISAAQSMWRLQHAVKLEQGIFATGHREKIDSIDAGHPEVDAALAASETFLERARELALLTTYEGRLRRALDRDLASLRALQAERKAKHDKALEQATAFVQYAHHRGETYEPENDFVPASAWGGFVFSEEVIYDRWDRAMRYENARQFRINGKDPCPKPKSDPPINLAA